MRRAPPCPHGNPIGPRACYDEGKRCAETLFFDYRRQRGLDIKVARIFNTYGPRMHPSDGRVVSTFILQALWGEPVGTHGNGAQTRSFCFVDEMVEAILRLMDSAPGVTGPVNLGNPEEIRISDLARKVIELTGSASRIRHLASVEDDPDRRHPDISRARDLLDWTPRIPLAEGLDRTIPYFTALHGSRLGLN